MLPNARSSVAADGRTAARVRQAMVARAPRDRVFGVVAVVGLVATALTVAVTARSMTLAHPAATALIHGFDVASWTAVGLITLHRTPESALGRLMLAVAALFACTTLMALPDPALFDAGRLLAAAVPVVVLATVLAFPSGSVDEPSSRSLIAVAALGTFVVWAPLFLCGGQLPLTGTIARCLAGCPASPVHVVSLGPAGEVLDHLARTSTAAVAFALTVAMIVRLRRASPASRSTLAPPLACIVLTAILLAADSVLDNVDGDDHRAQIVTWLGVVATGMFPYALLLGQARGRLFGAMALHRAVRELAPHHERGEVREVLAEALGDRQLELCYWVPTLEGYVDRAGRPVRVDGAGSRAATSIEVDGTPVAAILHDPALDASPGLVEAAGKAALLALENERLEAELRSSIQELQASRGRLLSVGVEERRRMERDLHDTAQNRLVALRIRLDLAAERAAEIDPELAEGLTALGEDAQAALESIRRVARGMYPPLLTSSGVVDALDAELPSAAVPVTLLADDVGRSTPEAEVAVYFVCWEAVQNAAKHAGKGASVMIRMRRSEGELAFSIFDDGAGYDPHERSEGFGRTAMRDRIGAVGGVLTVHSSPGHGTLVSGRLRWPPRVSVREPR